MAPIDWFLLVFYLIGTLLLGLWLARRNQGEDDYFVAGRRLSGGGSVLLMWRWLWCLLLFGAAAA